MINVSLATTLLISAVVTPKHLQALFEGYMLAKQGFSGHDILLRNPKIDQLSNSSSCTLLKNPLFKMSGRRIIALKSLYGFPSRDKKQTSPTENHLCQGEGGKGSRKVELSLTGGQTHRLQRVTQR